MIVVSGSAPGLGANLATGPSTAFSLETLETAPSINRDVKDIVRIDPRVYLDANAGGTQGNDGILCAGANPRFNSLTVDGIRLNDAFGLNSNGYPTERIPFTYDAIDQVAVELAPFDVEYGSFTACNVNAVTKSGNNEFHGSVFIDYNDDTLIGNRADDEAFPTDGFTNKRYGGTLSGPLLKDKVFFFLAYEKQESSNLFGGNTPEAKGVSEADFARITQIASDLYGYEVSRLPTALANEDEKFLAKIDWNITDRHRAAFTYNYNDGFNNDPSDGDGNELPEFNHFYERGAELNSYAGSLYSDWTDTFSTEFRVSYVDLQNRQNSLGGLDQWGEVQIEVGDSTVYLGADDSRHANQLSYELWTYKAKADWVLGDHILTFGAEREDFDVFNLFVQEVKGEWIFESIDDFESGLFDSFRYENAAGTNNAADAAAEFGYAINTIYAQDEWQVNDKLNIVAGLRFDYYSSDDEPEYNPDFEAAYGFRNDETLDGKSILQPRVGFTYEYNPDLLFRGGIGLFSGGNPNVWISNNYSNNGVTLFDCRNRGRSGDCVGDGTLNNINDFTYTTDPRGVFYSVPDEFIQAVEDADGGGPVNALDPDFEIPAQWKANLGFTYDFDTPYAWAGGNYTLNVDLLYSKTHEAALVQSLDALFGSTSTAPDGRTVYGASSLNDFVLTNADDKAEAFSFSTWINKSHDFGLDWTLGYAFTDAEDVNPMTSSVAFSNYTNFATADANDPGTATSDYEISHRFTFNANYTKNFFSDLDTSFGVFGSVSRNLPYSYVYGNSAFDGSPLGDAFLTRQLIYVPDGADDPLVASAPQSFLDFISQDDCLDDNRGEILDRNSCTNDWWTQFDVKFAQELPGFMPGHNSEFFLVMENVGNFINSDWGVLRDQNFPGNRIVDVALDSGDVDSDGNTNEYVYTNFREDPNDGFVLPEPSLWSVRVGLRYEF
ncbi:Oar-like outer membrane protein protein, OmpA family protein [Parvularcula bermudensis HTCC2503]|uniref:Oar-like outer membrane protein protein, OmpA family protein n=1 Tax=Parvularcula bermudensis (strain ATCC BAA-594 / HTCC2503 / KCTC 12087) TaxID=314260 RepID=E0TC88_PARBH|nr:TonB-dependent receptor [Parvularcula bermudensis]ADM08521.1 Oar-like outer membrane protein protein, OmpA family protein [Parvularcula bermudensis HTCC2503]